MIIFDIHIIIIISVIIRFPNIFLVGLSLLCGVIITTKVVPTSHTDYFVENIIIHNSSNNSTVFLLFFGDVKIHGFKSYNS